MLDDTKSRSFKERRVCLCVYVCAACVRGVYECVLVVHAWYVCCTCVICVWVRGHRSNHLEAHVENTRVDQSRCFL